MATTSQELNINHTYAKESEDVGEEIERLLVTGFLYNVHDRHNQSTPHVLRLQQMNFFFSLCCSWWIQTLNLLDFVYTDAAYSKSPVCYLILLSSLLKKVASVG